jgi:hypothetical protein
MFPVFSPGVVNSERHKADAASGPAFITVILLQMSQQLAK